MASSSSCLAHILECLVRIARQLTLIMLFISVANNEHVHLNGHHLGLFASAVKVGTVFNVFKHHSAIDSFQLCSIELRPSKCWGLWRVVRESLELLFRHCPEPFFETLPDFSISFNELADFLLLSELLP